MFHRRQGSTTQGRSSRSDGRAAPAAPRKRALIPLAAVAATLLLAGCGEDDESSTSVAEETTSTTTGPASAGGPPPDMPPTGNGSGDDVELTEIGSFDQPVYVAQPPGAERDELYVVEQTGRIQRVAPDGTTSTFLDVSGEIVAGGEQGLLSVAFSPGFERNGLLYVDYTDTAGDTRVVEYRSEDGGETADPGSARELLAVEQPYSNHNGGQLQFDGEGNLLVGLGDGGSAGDPERTAQDPGSPLGKILRVDPRNPGEYEVYALGLRNPWRFSFDSETGALAIGDVGQDSVEEVDLVAAADAEGANFGWSAFEGDQRFNEDQAARRAVEPVLTYATEGDNCSVTGGYVVRDRALTSLYGRYLYGDFCAGELRSFTAQPGRPARDDRALGHEVENLSSFGEDRSGRIYATSLSGPVLRLDPAG